MHINSGFWFIVRAKEEIKYFEFLKDESDYDVDSGKYSFKLKLDQ